MHGVDSLHQMTGNFGVLQQLARLPCGNGQQYRVETREHLPPVAVFGIRADGMQSPAPRMLRVVFDPGDPCLQLHPPLVQQRLRPMARQGVHAGRRNPVGFICRQPRSGHPAVLVEHPNGVGAPGFAQAGHGLQGQFKTRVAHREVLDTVVETAKRAVARGHAPTRAGALFEHPDPVAGLGQRAGAGDARDAGAYDGDVPGLWHGEGSCMGCCCWTLHAWSLRQQSQPL